MNCERFTIQKNHVVSERFKLSVESRAPMTEETVIVHHRRGASNLDCRQLGVVFGLKLQAILILKAGINQTCSASEADDAATRAKLGRLRH